MTTRASGTSTAVAAALISGVAVFVNGRAIRHFDDVTVYTTVKNVIAGAVLLVALVGVRGVAGSVSARELTAMPARSRWRLAVIAVVGGSVPFVLFFEGFARTTSNDAAFIHKTLVVWVAIGATLVLRERFTAVHAVAIALLLVGHAVLAGGIGGLTAGRGEAMILAATLLWSIEVVIAKQVLPDVSSQLAATIRIGGGGVLLVGWLVVTGRLTEITALGVSQWAWLLLTGTTLAAFVSTWYLALARAPAIDVTAILVLGAVVTGLLNVVVVGVPVTSASFGWVLIVVAAGAVAGQARPLGAAPAPVDLRRRVG